MRAALADRGTAYDHESDATNRSGETPATVAVPTAATAETTVTEEGSELERSIGLVGGLAVGVGTLIERGLPTERIHTESTSVERPTQAIVDRSTEFDVIVMGEGESTLLTTILGETTERIAEGAVAPVLGVRRRAAA
ncbi:universal stress protein [Haloplanus halobius]|uniref:universal stress protein n=1 Tax=Haloplanus halobius TaxID=2934938 RepID=UPI003CE4F342